MSYKNDFYVDIEFRESGNGLYIPMACAKTTGITTKQENLRESICGSGVTEYYDTVSEVKTTVMSVRNPQIVKSILGATISDVPAGTFAIDEKITFGQDKALDLPLYISNDGNGVTSMVIKSLDGATTYDSTTDYVVTIKDNRTRITLPTGSTIVPGVDIQLTGSIEVNSADKSILDHGLTIGKKFDIRITGHKIIGGKKCNYIATCEKGNLAREYITNFIDKINGGEPEGTELLWKFREGQRATVDEISKAEANL